MGKTAEEKKAYQLEFSRRWAKNNPEKVKAAKARWYAKHKEKIHAERRANRFAYREKLRAAKLAWEAANPEMVAMQRARRRIRKMNTALNNALRYHYEVTLANFNEVLLAQGSVCAICGTARTTSRSGRLVVDHDHANGKLRGLLCHRCNCGLGYFKDRTELIRRALAYLEGFNDADDTTNWAGRVRSVLEKLPEASSEGGCVEGVDEVESNAGTGGQDPGGADVADDLGTMAA